MGSHSLRHACCACRASALVSRLLAWLQRHQLVLAIAALTYIPVIFSSPGDVGADTKTYLYLDPGGVLRDARLLWDSDVALGTVTHQNVGYLWPMGPFYWVFETLGSPDWFAQRIWLGSLLFAAAMGVRFLLRVFDWSGPGLGVAMAAYGLSPYLLDYSARISAVLLPWAGLPWMIGLTVLAVRHGGWRHPARFALVVLTVGSVNATSLLLVGLAPVLWLFHVTVVERSVPWRRSVAAALRIGLGSAVVSVWWVAGLVIQGRYSLPVTRYTETYETVAGASTAPEILRGLGYWFFYGNDKFGAWIRPSVEYTQGVWLLFLTFGLVVLALISATTVRWRHRSFFLGLLVLGALIGIGSHPFEDPSFLGRLFKDFTRSDAGLALRSTPRAAPMVVLATSVLIGCVTAAAQERVPRLGKAFTLLTLAAIILANPAMWRVRMIEEHLHRSENLPTYWLEAAAAFDDNDDGSRIWELPGSDFASYRWGNTVDPITPGLIERGYVARELVPFGSAESADLLTAFDRRLQEGSLETASVVPIARLMSVGDLVHRADLTYERFRTPRPVPLAAFLESIPSLGAPIGFGEPTPNVAGPEQTLLDEIELSIDPSLPHVAPVTSYAVPDPLDIVRLRSSDAVLIVVGDGEGLVDAAAAGVLDLDRTVVFGADLAITTTFERNSPNRRPRSSSRIPTVVGLGCGDDPRERRGHRDRRDRTIALRSRRQSTPGLSGASSTDARRRRHPNRGGPARRANGDGLTLWQSRHVHPGRPASPCNPMETSARPGPLRRSPRPEGSSSGTTSERRPRSRHCTPFSHSSRPTATSPRSRSTPGERTRGRSHHALPAPQTARPSASSRSHRLHLRHCDH